MLNRRFIFIIFVSLVGFWWFTAVSSIIATPHVTYLRWFNPGKTAFMRYDKNDNLSWQFIPLSKISKLLQQAVVLTEDDQFFVHQGVDIEAIKKAMLIDWKRRTYKRGASTITMQLARNLYLSPRKSLVRKFRELLIALKLERELPKERILELYLNVSEWGNGIYGVSAAARHYFGKNASSLSKHEAAFLAAILPRPRFYDKHRGGPFLNQRIATIERLL